MQLPGELCEPEIRKFFVDMYCRHFTSGEIAEFIALWRASSMGPLDSEGLDALFDTGALDILRRGELKKFKDTSELWAHIFASANGIVAGNSVKEGGDDSSWDGGSISESPVTSSS